MPDKSGGLRVNTKGEVKEAPMLKSPTAQIVDPVFKELSSYIKSLESRKDLLKIALGGDSTEANKTAYAGAFQSLEVATQENFRLLYGVFSEARKALPMEKELKHEDITLLKSVVDAVNGPRDEVSKIAYPSRSIKDRYTKIMNGLIAELPADFEPHVKDIQEIIAQQKGTEKER